MSKEKIETKARSFVANDIREKALKEKLEVVESKINELLAEQGLDKELKEAQEKYKEAKTLTASTKDKLGELAVSQFEKTKKKGIYPGITVAEYTEMELSEDEEQEAVIWAIEQGYDELLDLDKKNYQKFLETGVIKDIPGRIKKDPRPRISLKTLRKHFEKEGESEKE